MPSPYRSYKYESNFGTIAIALAAVIGATYFIIQWNSDPMFKWIIGLIAGIVAVRMFGGRK